MTDKLASGWNLPPGCFASDLPGYWDIECPTCHGEDDNCETCGGSGEVDSRVWRERRMRDQGDERE